MEIPLQDRPGGRRGLTWGRRSGAATLVALVLGSGLTVAPAASAAAPGTGTTTVIVEREAGAGSRPELAVVGMGGSVGAELGIIDGFRAEVPTAALRRLERAAGVADVTADASVTMLASSWRADHDLGTLRSVLDGAGVPSARSAVGPQGEQLTGAGVGVALIDSGVVPVEGLDAPGKVVNGPDLSFESQRPGVEHLDTFGHGTHLAGIIAGRDDLVGDGPSRGERPGGAGRDEGFVGVAPGATIVNVKVAASDGAVDVSQVIAALDWVVQHRNDPGLDIRVVNLSFGTEGVQPYQLDPLAHAVEVAWRHGLVVVVAAGNGGNLTDTLTNPATDPFVLAVGASDHRGTRDRRDDGVATFSARGSQGRTPDLVAPGRSLVSLRNPGSSIDRAHPGAVVADSEGSPRFFRGSGTSQAAAVVSGAAALLLQQRPHLTPDQVKELLTSTASPFAGTDVRLQGSGLLDVAGAARAETPSTTRAVQAFAPSTGTGSLELSRGGSHVADPLTGEELVGEQDIFGSPWDGGRWAPLAAAGSSWSGGEWNGSAWSGQGWGGDSWTGLTWSGLTWSGLTWSGLTWSGLTWSGLTWSGLTWSGLTWSGLTWSGLTWS